MVCEPFGTSMPFVKSGKMKILASTNTMRSTHAPDVPTMTEAGIPKSGTDPATGLLAPAATPRDVVAVLNGALVKALQTPEIKERFDPGEIKRYSEQLDNLELRAYTRPLPIAFTGDVYTLRQHIDMVRHLISSKLSAKSNS